MVGGLRFAGNFAWAPFQVTEGNVLRQRCDARGFTPLPIEIIARQKVARAFEAQKGEQKESPMGRLRALLDWSALRLSAA
jgi:hypothetical protein